VAKGITCQDAGLVVVDPAINMETMVIDTFYLLLFNHEWQLKNKYTNDIVTEVIIL